ncbi:glycosyltransferase family 4 protein [Butyrivibrio sp. MC2021]|uniref:glycosyltransferase family 4 protein n=1 Tax=Butyrivibrio sp. MC2021 TaxID=1408306 RepID=UPI00047D7548|nr:glycosyltransferase family 4 protein [Butyrivibrio sp. MC2021]
MGKYVKVLMVGPDRSVHGGISAVVNEFYKAGLDQRVTLKYIGTMKEGSKLKKLFVAAFAYARFLAALPGFDVVHVNFSSDMSFLRKSYFIRAAHKKGKPVVLHQHGGDFTTFYGKELDDKGRKKAADTLKMGDIMLVLTQTWKDYFSGIISSDKIRVFPNGIKTEGIADVGTADKDYNKILFLGRVCRDKGMDELLLAMKNIHEKNKDVKLYIGGIFEDPAYEARIREMQDYVTYLGWVTGDEKGRILKECGILTLPSYFEGFGMVLIEAMLRKSAVVASNVGGIPDIIEDGKDGLLVPAKDAAALEQALLKAVTEKDLSAELGENGRAKVLQKYSVEKNVEELVSIYEKMK